MTAAKDGGPAFPVFTFGGSVTPFVGMSLLEWYAGMALQGLLSRGGPADLVIDGKKMGYDAAAWALAQAMMDTRPKP